METYKLMKSHRKGDNWRVKVELDTEVNLAAWTFEITIADSSEKAKTDPLLTVALTESGTGVYIGELTKVQSLTLDRKPYFIAVVGENGNNRDTLTEQGSRIIVW